MFLYQSSVSLAPTDKHTQAPGSVHAKSLQLCPTLCDPVDCSPPGSSVHGYSPWGCKESNTT